MRSTEIQYKLHADPELQAKEWDRQPRESAKAFQGFSLYRNLAEKRTYQQVAEQLHCNGSNIRRWATKWNWYERAREWDIHQDRIAQEVQVGERRKMAERQASIGMQFQSVAAMELGKLRQKLENGVLDEKTGKTIEFSLSAREIAKLAEMGSELERRSRGENEEDPGRTYQIIFGNAPIDDENPCMGDPPEEEKSGDGD